MFITEKLKRIWGEHRLLRYLFSGGVGFVVNIGVLYFMADILGIWYLVSGITAFIISVTVSFFLHKWVTFEYRQSGSLAGQYSGFLGVQVINLLINSTILVITVEVFGLWHLIGQTIGSAVVAVLGYVMYRYVIFREKTS